ALDRSLDVGLRVDDDRILAAHFRGHSLEPALSRMHLGAALEYPDADILGAGEGDEACPRVIYEEIADVGARSRKEVHHANRDTGLLHDLEDLESYHWGVAGGLHNHRVARHHRSHDHVRVNGTREVPRGDYYTDP